MNLQGAGEHGRGYRVGTLELASQCETGRIGGTEDLETC